jgi:ribosome-binding factor A
MSTTKIDRVNSELARKISEVISYEMKDVRITGMVSVLRVETTKDLKQAKVYLSILGSDNADDTLKGIKSGAGFIKSRLASSLNIRQIPELIFIKDESIEYSIKINKILEDINNK